MNWQERAEGYFFPQQNLSTAIESKLQILILEDSAQISAGGTLIPFEKSVLLSEEDSELLNLPPRNPYQVSIRTEGYIGGKNFKYVVELLNSEGRRVESKISGALVHCGENLFRLNAEQFALIKLTELGNEEPLVIVKKIQSQSKAAEARIDKYISEKKIILPDKLCVDFQESGDSVKVAPILLENRDGKLKPLDSSDFQDAFNNRKKILSVYRGRNGQYVFDETLRDGLAQIKSVAPMSKADASRYKLQPRELFSGEAFDFNYSDRVIGVEEIKISTYQNFSWETDWGEGGIPAKIPAHEGKNKRSKAFALKIKENFERIDYKKNSAERQGKFFAEVLCPGIKLYPH